MKTLFLDALAGKNHSSRPPIWVMRQAGRYLPEYRKVRDKYSFLEMVRNPEIAAEITLQPIQRFQMDAAIIFSDILVVPETLGMSVRFEEGAGPIYDKPIASIGDIESLHLRDIKSTVGYVGEAIRLTKKELDVPLIGFCGAPFTVASYLIEGKSSRDLKKTKQLMHRNPEAMHLLLDKITTASIEYLKMQVEAGADAVQIFDSWAHFLSEPHFRAFSTHYHKKIIEGIGNIPTIVFCRGASAFINDLVNTKATALGLDWTCSLASVRKEHAIALQGNMDPYALYGTKDSIQNEAQRIVDSMKGDSGFIFNLGHGIFPDIPLDAVYALVETVQCR